jgi:hypothetical protein
LLCPGGAGHFLTACVLPCVCPGQKPVGVECGKHRRQKATTKGLTGHSANRKVGRPGQAFCVCFGRHYLWRDAVRLLRAAAGEAAGSGGELASNKRGALCVLRFVRWLCERNKHNLANCNLEYSCGRRMRASVKGFAEGCEVFVLRIRPRLPAGVLPSLA